jgi:sugar/nucleoside kinase (ribokinase family)
MIKVNLTGNIIIDTIINTETFPIPNNPNNAINICKALGGIFNICWALEDIKNISYKINGYTGNSDIDYLFIQSEINKYFKSVDSSGIQNIQNKKTSQALIVNDYIKQEKTSVVDWGICTQLTEHPSFTEKVTWTHIAYLDKLEKFTLSDMNTIRNNSKIISTDFCSTNFNNKSHLISLLKLVDFLIISDSEAKGFSDSPSDVKETLLQLGNIVKNSIIVHFSDGSYVSDGDTIWCIKNNNPKINISTLGAGDIFAGYFISNYLNSYDLSPNAIVDICRKCHNDTYQKLIEKNKYHGVDNEKI